ncbi:tRNA wybutosine-synthesizing protein 3 homolog isoform X2 [Ahaetulla prasina]|uniref:tRNA wybutosine-synthesizing protein 3 homolog isoform X2 n=1 Tax=Ahaetulla prasina TaxID=499056 RepID=UPI002648B3D7|nr:tRNA wybutosine-synthesizing protein 3 homolog isoform X2 [Ahaetulla prasina]
MADFKRWKEQRLSRADASRKGSVDEPIEEIVRLLNGRETFCTTSSCSGRVVVLEQPPAAAPAAGTAGFEIQKQSCTWLMVTHQLCSTKDVLTALQKAAADAIFKFEPFVLHVQCQDLEDAQLLAVRSTHCLEVPLTQKGRLMVSEEYVDFVVQVANRKMEENWKRINRFYISLKFALESKNHSMNSLSEEKEKENEMDSGGRKKSQATKKDDGSPSHQNKNLESEDDRQSNTSIFH